MGAIISSIFGHDSPKEVREQLEILTEMAERIVTAESERMEAKAWEDKTLPIVGISDTQTLCRIGVKEGENLSEDIDKIVKDFTRSNEGKWVDGITATVHALLKQLLGGASTGRQEARQFHVAFDSNALLRIDYYIYMYTLHSDGILKEHGENMLCCVMQVAVLDSLKANPQLVLYEVTKCIGSENLEEVRKELEKDSDFAKLLYKQIRSIDKAAKEEPEEGAQ